LDRLLGVPQLCAAGQHGLEIRNARGILHQPPREGDDGDLAPIIDYLQLLRQRHPGLLVEDKGATVAIHYRQVPALGGHLSRLLKGVLAMQPTLRLQRGKFVYELKPAGADKGTAIATLMTDTPFRGRRPVFIGDDLTDEHGFETVNRLDGVSIKVGSGRTCAQYRIADVDAVHRWLGCMDAAPQSKGEQV
ncbi:MAG TPA: trehalose-phosphatase, partial [Rhodocyclaceae bacterium]|nr:trehalose-phosphatase [Rhodocyclaceae bacterium]